MSTTTKPAPAKGLKDQVADLLNEHFKTVNAIHEDYLLADGALTEIGAARENLFAQLEKLEERKPAAKPVTVIDIVRFFEGNRTTSGRCGLDTGDVHEVLDAIGDDDDIASWLKARGGDWVMVKTESLAQRDKLEEFIRAEIWPDYGMQQKNILL